MGKRLSRTKRCAAMFAGAMTVAAGLTVGTASTAAAAGTCTAAMWYGGSSNTHTFLPVDSNDDVGCIMGQGARGNAVYRLQQVLNRCNGAGLVMDGQYGPATARAVAAVQRSRGIPVDGVYGPRTRNVMRWDFRSGTSSYTCRFL